MGQGQALARGARRQQHGRRRCGLPEADRGDVGPDELHRVVDGEQGGDVAAGAVDVDVDVLVGVLRLEVDELGADQVGDGVVDRRAQEDDVLLEQPGVQVVGPLAPVGLLDHRGDEVVPDGASSGWIWPGWSVRAHACGLLLDRLAGVVLSLVPVLMVVSSWLVTVTLVVVTVVVGRDRRGRGRRPSACRGRPAFRRGRRPPRWPAAIPWPCACAARHAARDGVVALVGLAHLCRLLRPPAWRCGRTRRPGPRRWPEHLGRRPPPAGRGRP